ARYSRMPGSAIVVVNHGSSSRRQGCEAHGGTAPRRYCLARYSAMAPTSASSRASPESCGSVSMQAYRAAESGASRKVSTSSGRAISCGTPERTHSTASARVLGRIGRSIELHVLEQKPLLLGRRGAHGKITRQHANCFVNGSNVED